MRKISYIKAIGEAICEEMVRDEKVFLMGESVRGGVYQHTEGLIDQFGPDRVVDTPLAENAIVGAALGIAIAGYRPIADLMYADFFQIASDELSKAGQWRMLQGGKHQIPIVYMAGNGGGLMIANDHSKMLTANVLTNPGIKMVQASDPYNAKGLLKSAIRDNNPVVFFWHKNLFSIKGEVPTEEYLIPLGKANIVQNGDDVTLIAYSATVQMAQKAVNQIAEDISVEIIDLQSLEPLDIDTIIESVKKTSRVLIVDEDHERCGLAGEIIAQIIEHAFDYLDAPPRRVCAKNLPIPGGFLESEVLPQVKDVVAAIKEVAL